MADSDPHCMSDEPAAEAEVPAIPQGRRPFRISRLMLKELRETLRDRRTLITLILMPLLVYPALSLVFKTFLINHLSGLNQSRPIAIHIAWAGEGSKNDINAAIQSFGIVASTLQARQSVNQPGDRDPADLQESGDQQNAPRPNDPFPEFRAFGDHLWTYLPQQTVDEMADFLQLGQGSVEDKERLDVGIFVSAPTPDSGKGFRIKIIQRDDALSRSAASYLTYWFRQANDAQLQQRLAIANIDPTPTWQATTETVGQTDTSAASPVPLASLIPLVLVLMTITGAVYPAIDLTAGERERGTLETLMAAPIPRFGILFSKFVAVVVVAMLTAMLNLIGMFSTIWAFQLDKQFGFELFNLATMSQILALLVLFAGFFSAILLVVTSFAKSFKEAQVYLIPIILLSLGPGLMAMAPGMELSGVNAVFPMVNILLLARDVINGDASLGYAWIAILSTAIYGVLALALAARLFGSDAILNADANGLKDMIRRPRQPQSTASIGAALFCTLLLVPLNFIAVEWLNRFPAESSADFTLRFIMLAWSLVAIFMAFPAAVAWYRRLTFSSTFGLRLPKPIHAVAAVLLGLSLWPIVMWLTTVWHSLYGLVAGQIARDAWNDQLVELTQQMAGRIQAVPEWTVLVCLAIAPAVSEEFFFRGMLQRSLVGRIKAWQAILISAVVFGAFHTISSSVIAVDRFIPTALVGLILGYAAYRSNSLWPGVILHAIHNACVSFLAHFQKELAAQPWFPQDESIPWQWLIAGIIVAGVGMALMTIGKRPEESPQPAGQRQLSPNRNANHR